MSNEHVTKAIQHHEKVERIRDIYSEKFRQLSVCQRNILLLVSQGLTDRDIALRRNICPDVLIRQKKAVIQKLNPRCSEDLRLMSEAFGEFA